LSFNVEHKDITAEGRKRIAKVITESDANIVGMQEINKSEWMEDIKKHLTGKWYAVHQSKAQGDVAIFSKFPFGKNAAKQWGYQMRLSNNKSVWLFNCHLAPYPYGPWQLNHPKQKVCDPSKPDCIKRVVEDQRTAREPMVLDILDSISRLPSDSKDNVLITGDFNEPSHLDWTKEAMAKKLHVAVVPWPTSIQFEKAGFIDSYRKLYPNPAEHPGITWSCYAPHESKGIDYNDRLDFIYYSGKEVTPVKTITIGPTGGKIKEDIEIDVDTKGYKYPSDHRAIMTTFTIQGN
jgi:exonuclease III